MTPSPKITLYGYATSPFVRKTGAFLYYKGLDFTHIPVNPINPTATIGHTKQTMVPVLEIDGEWRTESSDHGHWLDAIFPDKPLCPTEHEQIVRDNDAWASAFLHAGFRALIDTDLNAAMRARLWRFAEILNSDTPIPNEIRSRWPDLVANAPFIKAMGENMDLTESYSAMQMRLAGEFIERLKGGPFLGGLNSPSMADLAIFPNAAFSYMVGCEDEPAITKLEPLKNWFYAVAKHLPANPILVQDYLVVNSLDRLAK